MAQNSTAVAPASKRRHYNIAAWFPRLHSTVLTCIPWWVNFWPWDFCALLLLSFLRWHVVVFDRLQTTGSFLSHSADLFPANHFRSDMRQKEHFDLLADYTCCLDWDQSGAISGLASDKDIIHRSDIELMSQSTYGFRLYNLMLLLMIKRSQGFNESWGLKHKSCNLAKSERLNQAVTHRT